VGIGRYEHAGEAERREPSRMDDLIFPEHVRTAMQADSITEHDAHLVTGDYDSILEYDNGRTEYGRWLDDGRWIVVIIEDDGRTAVSAWEDKRRRRRRRWN
jgi:hypothetical protein